MYVKFLDPQVEKYLMSTTVRHNCIWSEALLRSPSVARRIKANYFTPISRNFFGKARNGQKRSDFLFKQVWLLIVFKPTSTPNNWTMCALSNNETKIAYLVLFEFLCKFCICFQVFYRLLTNYSWLKSYWIWSSFCIWSPLRAVWWWFGDENSSFIQAWNLYLIHLHF